VAPEETTKLLLSQDAGISEVGQMGGRYGDLPARSLEDAEGAERCPNRFRLIPFRTKAGDGIHP